MQTVFRDEAGVRAPPTAFVFVSGQIPVRPGVIPPRSSGTWIARWYAPWKDLGFLSRDQQERAARMLLTLLDGPQDDFQLMV
jgi:enamine deaminase RidA (YjgF/YER057c/UK114 family)